MKRLGQSKETVAYLTGLFYAILDDLVEYYPELEKCVAQDKRHISSLILNRGVAFFMLDLPELDRLLIAALEHGTYISLGEPLTRSRHRRGTIPLLFEGMYLRVFENDGVLRADADASMVGFLHQLFQLAKKFKHACQQEKVDGTIEKFHTCDLSLRLPTWNGWANADEVFSSVDGSLSDYNDNFSMLQSMEHYRGCQNSENHRQRIEQLTALTQKVFDLVVCDMGVFNPLENRFKHGPGAVSDRTPDRYKYRFETWSDQLEPVFPSCEFAYANYMDWADRHHELKDPEKLVSSKLIAVPKTYKGPRLIACEPTAHQWCQQSLRDFLHNYTHTSVLNNFISFERQDLSGEMALMASKTHDLVTADLSDASDRVSCYVVERAFRRNPSLLAALASCRTRYVQQDLVDYIPKTIKLRKFSTMGSAVTFPVESIIFCVIGIAALLYSEGKLNPSIHQIKHLRGQLRVFGDDIIIKNNSAWDNMNDLLTLFDFKVNAAKTFTTGKFRESCGVDAYAGIDITPVRVNTTFKPDSPESVLSSVELSNHLHNRGLWKAADHIRQTIDPNELFVIRRRDSGSIGFDSFCGASIGSNRWCSATHQFMAKTLVFSSKTSINATDGLSCFIQWLVEKPSYGSDWASGSRTPSSMKMRLGRVPVRSFL